MGDDMAEALAVAPSRAHLCAGGCQRLVVDGPRGRPRRFATPACREAARGRLRAGLPEDFRRRERSHGRSPVRRRPLSIEDVRINRHRILELADRRGVGNVRVFGSVARGDARLDSDLDLLLDLAPERSILELGGFAMDVSEIMETEVDVVEADTLDGRMREQVLRDAVPL